MKKRILSLLLTLSLLLGLLPTAVLAAETSQPFADVNEQDWFSEAVAFVYRKGLMSGTGKHTFSPHDAATRGMIVTVLHRLEGCPDAAPAAFPDVSGGAYYALAVAWAAENDIVNGYDDGTFGPDAPITRQQLAAILHRYFLYKGRTVSSAGDLSAFRDAAQVRAWAREGMQWAVGAGLITGVGSDTLDPDGNATRAQTAMLLMRLSRLLDAKETAAPAASGSSSGGSGNSGGGSSAAGGSAEPYASSILGMTLENRSNLTVTLQTETGGTLHLRFLTEDKKDLLFDEVKVQVAKNGESAAYPLTDAQKQKLPDCFVIVAQLKDASGSALCNPYTCLDYTQTYRSFQAKTPADFPDHTVLDLGTSASTGTPNFAVLRDGVKVLTGSASKNVLAGAEGGVYTFTNIDDQIITLSIGDMLYFRTQTGEHLFLKVSSLTVSGDTATITESSDVTMSDFFLFIRVDANAAVEQPESAAPAVQTLSSEAGIESRASFSLYDDGEKKDDADLTERTKLSASFKTDHFSVKLSGTASIHYTVEYDPEIFGEDYLSFSMSSALKADLDVTLGATSSTNDGNKKGDESKKDDADDKKKGEILLLEIPVPLPGSVNMVDSTLKLSIPYKIEESASADFTVKSSLTSGFRYNTIDGHQKIDKKEFSIVDLKLKGKLKAEVGLALEVTLATVGDILKASVGAKSTISFTGTVQTGGALELSGAESKHGCTSCFDGKLSYDFGLPLKLSYKVSDHLKGDVLNFELVGISMPLGSFYVSLVQDNWFPAGKSFYGLGECPYKKYKVRFLSYDNCGEQVDNCPVTVTGTNLKGNEQLAASGSTVFTAYLSLGTYTANSAVESYVVSREFTVSKAMDVKLEAPQATVAGLVTEKAKDGETGKALSGVTLTATNTKTGAHTTATTRSDGTYTMELPNGTYRIGLSARGYQSKLVPEQVIAGNTDLSFALEKEDSVGTLVFTVTDRDTSEPISGASVVLSDAQSQPTAIGLTTAAGQYTAENLEEGSCRFTVSATGYAALSGTAAVVRGEETPIAAALTKEVGTLSGTILGKEDDTETPLEGAKLTLWCDDAAYASTMTGADGSYTLDALPVGGYTVKVSAEGYSGTAESRAIQKGQNTYSATLTKLTASGTCGETLYWSLSGDGVLTICGEGKMYDYYYKNSGDTLKLAPWSAHSEKIKTIIVEEGVTGIGEYAFSPENVSTQNGLAVTGVELPSTLERIGKFAFYAFQSLEAITLPDRVTVISGSTFAHCTALKQVSLPANLKEIQGSVFYACSSLEAITLPSGLTTIGDQAFFYTRLKSVVIPDGVTKIGKQTFSCASLTSVTLPDGLTTIGEQAFAGAAFETISLPDSVTTIQKGAFARCENLTGIVLPEKVTALPEAAFSDCTALTGITVPAGLRSIGKEAFKGCTKLSGISLPDNMGEIGNCAFEGCTALTAVSLPTKLTGISYGVFQGCTALEQISLPAGLRSIGVSAFEACSALKNVSFPTGLMSIGDAAFRECAAFTEIILPAGVTSIGRNAFADCTNVKTLVLPNVSALLRNEFNGLTSLETIYWPASLTRQDNNTITCRGPLTIYYAGSEEAWAAVETHLPNNINITMHYNTLYTYPVVST